MKLEAGMQLLGDRGAADQLAPLEDQGPQAGLREVGAVDEAVVAAADDDRVVLDVLRLRHGHAVFRSGWNRGMRAVRASTRW